MGDGQGALRKLPAVQTLLALPEMAELTERFGRPLVTDAIRGAIERERRRILAGATEPGRVTAVEVEAEIRRLQTPSLRPVINGTGCVLHTNLGRAPLAAEALEAVQAVGAGYSALELDLRDGKRGDRHAHVAELITDLLGTDSGLAFNNCAGAVLVMLSALCRGGEVIVARGELVEIGGGFRVPDVMRASGAELVEVGTTNKVYARDYRAALSERTKAILHVHRSNFALVGFTAEPSTGELAEVAREAQVPLLADLGSGLLADDDTLGRVAPQMASEPRPKQVLQAGADVVAFSGDKLLGGPQAGLVAGRSSPLAAMRKHPLARALRADKLTLAALEATLRMYREGRALEVPVIRDLAVAMETLEARAQHLASAITKATRLPVEIRDGVSVPGGGTLPLAELPSKLVVVGGSGEEGRILANQLRWSDPPVITRVFEDRVALDVRTVQDEEVPLIVGAMTNTNGPTTRYDTEED